MNTMLIYSKNYLENLSNFENDNIPNKTNTSLEEIDFSEILDSDSDSDDVLLKDSYSSLKMIVNDSSCSDGSNNSIKERKKKEESEFQKKINNIREKRIKKEQIVQKIFKEVESKQTSENEANMIEDEFNESKKPKKEQKLSDYIKQKLGKRKRQKLSDGNSKDSNSITDFFDRDDKRRSKSIKVTHPILPNPIEENKIEKENKEENKKDKDETDKLPILKEEKDELPILKEEKDELPILKEEKDELPILKEEKKGSHLLSYSDDEINIDLLLSSDSENEEEEEEKKRIKEKNNLEFEYFKKINHNVPNLINEINKNIDTQNNLLNNDKFNIELDNNEEKDTNIQNNNIVNNNTQINITTSTTNNNMDIEKDEDDLIEMSSLEGIKKIYITFYGYKLMPNKEFARIYPLTLEVPETAKFKTIFKAYCIGTNLKKDDMLFNYNNIEIFSTSSLKGMNMTSSLENYRIDVYKRNEYKTYRNYLKDQEKKKEEQKRKEELQKMLKMELKNSTFDDDDDLDSEQIIVISILDKNKKETEVKVNRNDTIEKLGLLYLKELSLSPTLLSKLQFYFDGEKLNSKETLKELDIDNEYMLDLKIDD